MSECVIRFAEESDIVSIMKFIDQYWKKEHILSRERKLFEWQYINNGKLNMVLGEREDGEIDGILGYIPYAKGKEKDISLALWKAKPGTAFLGVKLLMFLLKEEKHRNVFCNGINPKTTEGIYQRMGFKTGRLKQYYRLCEVAEYKIAKINEKIIPIIKECPYVSIKQSNTFLELKIDSTEKLFTPYNVPFKSKEYIAKRYFNHPAYEYMVYTVHENMQKAEMAIVLRIQECNDSRALRVIDVLGDYTKLGDVTQCIENLANQVGAEYIDMYELGLDESMLLKAGWLEVGTDDNIIPNYFAPYAQCNVDINISTTDENIVLFRGDGDQDRPN
jgi:hypothetical protein